MESEKEARAWESVIRFALAAKKSRISEELGKRQKLNGESIFKQVLYMSAGFDCLEKNLVVTHVFSFYLDDKKCLPHSYIPITFCS